MGGVKMARISNKGTIFKFLRHGKDRICKVYLFNPTHLHADITVDIDENI